MSTTIREKIIANIVSHLEEVRSAEGYVTEIGRRVLRARVDLDPDELAAVVVWPLPEEVEQLVGGKNICTFPVSLVGLKNFGVQDASMAAEEILGDLIKAMTAPAKDPTGSLADKVLYAGGGTDSYPEPGQSIVAASAVFNITYKTKIGDPYNQT